MVHWWAISLEIASTYPNTSRCATSRLCQYSSGLKYVLMSNVDCKILTTKHVATIVRVVAMGAYSNHCYVIFSLALSWCPCFLLPKRRPQPLHAPSARL